MRWSELPPQTAVSHWPLWSEHSMSLPSVCWGEGEIFSLHILLPPSCSLHQSYFLNYMLMSIPGIHFIHFYSHHLLSRNHLSFLSLSFCKRLEHSTKHLKCFSYNLGYILIIQLFSLQGIHLCQLVLFCSMNSSNFTSSLSSYYPKQSKSKKSCLLTAVLCYGCYNKLPQIERLKQHK